MHEHVFPRKDLKNLLLGLDPKTLINSTWMAETVERLAVGCVVLKREHDSVNGKKGESDSINPWRRYRGKIKLFENQNWPSSHLNLIRDAEVL